MNNPILRYPVRHPLLRNYIRFFWELRMDSAQLNHKIIPQKNINIRFNLNDTPHFVDYGNGLNRLEPVYFTGLQNQFINAHLKVNGNVHILGICFEPDGIYPFLKIPVSEFRNQMLGTSEIGFKIAEKISDRLSETHDTESKLSVLERELLLLLDDSNLIPERFRKVFYELKKENNMSISCFCQQNNLNIRKLERMYGKYVGLSANSYQTLNRFHGSLNQLLATDFSKLSDLAYDHGYFDQMHFIKEFKRFTGNTPRNFINQGNSILQIGNRK